ncbi:MAG: bifunctional DNA-formamidopyrimidine glycosylase/DNA-(apurinic or apyrimidinic site) lyase [Patescibacteria group bacterium]
MPELPEVETIKKRLESLVVGKTITQIEILHPKSFQGNVEQVIGQRIVALSRRAKLLQIILENGYSLLIHLKMTGQLIYEGATRVGGGHPTADWVKKLPSKHTRIIFYFSDKERLFFNDIRVFGWVRTLSPEEVKREFSKYGPDINDANLSASYLIEQFGRRSINIKQALMMNQIVAGVGNIYACDALNLAKIDPQKAAYQLTENEVVRLFEAAQTVINRGIEKGGATVENYVHVDGFAGQYQSVMLVYGKEGQACPNCGAKIIKMKVAGRGTYYCMSCQL